MPDLLADPSCNSVVIATRHDSHASLVQQALPASTFVEKPLCLTAEELTAIEAAHTGEQLLMVGFNRRFAPLLLDLQQLARLSGPKAFVYTCNAGSTRRPLDPRSRPRRRPPAWWGLSLWISCAI